MTIRPAARLRPGGFFRPKGGNRSKKSKNAVAFSKQMWYAEMGRSTLYGLGPLVWADGLWRRGRV